MNNQPHELIEHFFRHESASLIAVLTRAFGLVHLPWIEDAVQNALVAALHSWKFKGIPVDPAAWIRRVARNRLIDVLRRQSKGIDSASLALDEVFAASTESSDDAFDESQIQDSTLRLMFACCHPDLDLTSQVALTLKLLGGFSCREIARGFLISEEAAKKRVGRARQIIARGEASLEVPTAEELTGRLDAVHEVLYLMFNEGHCATEGNQATRLEMCEEAARLCHLLCEHPVCGCPASRALLALMLFHAARLPARIRPDGAVVLLTDQDRSCWDQNLIFEAEKWLARSAVGTAISRFHLEAGIARIHCLATNMKDTDWPAIIGFYDQLVSHFFSPVYVVNRAVALGQVNRVEEGLRELQALENHPSLRSYFLLDCALGQLYLSSGNKELARKHFQTARAAATCVPDQRLLDLKLSAF